MDSVGRNLAYEMLCLGPPVEIYFGMRIEQVVVIPTITLFWIASNDIFTFLRKDLRLPPMGKLRQRPGAWLRLQHPK